MRLESFQLAFVSMVLLFSGCGDGGLSRSEAKKAIVEKLNNEKDFPEVSVQVGEHYFTPPANEYKLDTVCYSLMAEGRNPAGYVPYSQPRGYWNNWHAASENGYITTTPHEFSGVYLGSSYTALKCTIKLTDKAKPFILKKDRGDVVTLKVVDGIDVEVTGVTKPADMFGHTVSEAEYTYTYKLNDLGKSLSTASVDANKDNPRKGKAAFRLFDDGWRL